MSGSAGVTAPAAAYRTAAGDGTAAAYGTTAGPAATSPTTSKAGTSGRWSEIAIAAARDAAPALLALAPLGIVVGVTAGRTGLGALLGVASAATIFGGTAQLSAFALLGGGAGVTTIILSVAVINARLIMYAAVLEPRFRRQPTWFRWLGPHFIIDPSFVLATGRDDLDDPVRFRRYWLALGCLLALAWSGLVALGIVVGPALSGATAVLAFSPAAVFLAMLVPRLVNRPALVAAGIAGVVTGVLTLGSALPAGTPVLIGSALGVVGAVLVQARSS